MTFEEKKNSQIITNKFPLLLPRESRYKHAPNNQTGDGGGKEGQLSDDRSVHS